MEVTVSGVNGISYPHLTTWEWQVAIYLFIGGLVAGLMIFSTLFRLTHREGFDRAILVADIVGLPLLAVGMFFLWLDLGQGWNAWRFFTIFELTSPMSWGSWILLFAMTLLFIRLWTHIPVPDPERRGGMVAVWRMIARFGQWLSKADRGLGRAGPCIGHQPGYLHGCPAQQYQRTPIMGQPSIAVPVLGVRHGQRTGLHVAVPGTQPGTTTAEIVAGLRGCRAVADIGVCRFPDVRQPVQPACRRTVVQR